MIRPHLSLRRPLAVLGAAFVGLAAAVAVAAPASAHHTEVRVHGDCDAKTGEWVVTWKVNSYAPDDVEYYKFIEVVAKTIVGDEVSDNDVPGIAVTDGDTYPHNAHRPLVATQRLPGTTTGASLTVRAQWDNQYVEESSHDAAIQFVEQCDKKETPPPATAKPTANVVADCDGNVVVTLQNGKSATAPARFTVTAGAGFTPQRVRVAPDGTETVEVPAKYATKITVTEAGQPQPLFDTAPSKPESCVQPGEPAGSYRSTCDHLIFEVANPKNGTTVVVTFTPNRGDKQTITVPAGASRTARFAASEGLTVSPSAEGMDETAPIAWEKPAGCGSGGGGPSLPVTGVAAGSLAAGAGLLVALGVTLFLVTRRRRVKFTA